MARPTPSGRNWLRAIIPTGLRRLRWPGKKSIETRIRSMLLEIRPYKFPALEIELLNVLNVGRFGCSMRRVVSPKLLHRREICLFCAFKHTLELRGAASLRPQHRTYRSSAPYLRPAGAAAARVEDFEDDFSQHTPSRELLGWRCRCNHVNAPRRSECTICTSPRPPKAELVYKGTAPSSPSPQPTLSAAAQVATTLPSRSPSQSPSPSSDSRKTDTSQPRYPPGPKGRYPSRTPFDSQRPSRSSAILDQVSSDFGQQGPPIRFGRHGGPKQRSNGDSDTQTSLTGTESGFKIRKLAVNGPPAPDGSVDQDALQSGDRSRSFRPFSGRNDLPGRRHASQERSQSQSTAPDPLSHSRIGAALKPMNRSRYDDRGSAAERTSNQLNPREPRWRSQAHDRSTQDRKATKQPGRHPSRHHDSGSIPQTTSPRSPVSSDVEIEEVDDVGGATPTLETEDDWSDRRKKADKDRGRRSRIFDVEEDNPDYTSRTAKVSSGKRRSAYRGSRPEFDPDMVEDILDEQKRKKKSKRSKMEAVEQKRPEIQIPEFISVEKLAQGLKVRLADFIDKLEEEGFEGARYDHVLDSGTSAMFAEIYGFEPIIDTIDETRDLVPRPPPEDPSVLPPRPPIVTIMGHVDHGKTTILDYFRNSSVVASEHGGITQHIGAFSVVMPGSERNITFLDTPGHAAFLDMRRRGANVTDIVVLVVAADDSVKAQTIEAIKHALEANVQIIVAINKIDKDDADIERVKRDLSQHDIVVEDYGGDFQVVPVSGKTGQGMADLEEAILTLADVYDFRAETDGQAEGWIIESKVGESGRVATVLVRRGTLRPGDFIVAGNTWARVRTLRNDAGALIQEAAPGTPVQIDGWRGEDPMAGSEVLQAADEQQAKDAVAVRQEREESVRTISDLSAINSARTEEAESRAKVLEWEREQGYMKMKANRRPKDNEGWVEKESLGPRQVHFLIKADVAGSTEALVSAVSTIGNKEVVANVVHSGTGELTESDIKLLAATGEVGYAITFNQRVDTGIRRLAEAANVQILDHNIIYKVTDVVAEKLAEQLPPIITHKVLGEAEVGDIFEITVKKAKVKIAGCRVTNGTIRRSEKIRVLRDGEVVYTGTLNSFKNIKKDVTEMRKGSECGMGFENWDSFEVGDQIQSFEEIHEKRSLY
ncbi:translation initiation factor IF-2 [Exophiala spinifera]|uniref:Translation initiation factor IF-2, mitochondrial n=1 Tax=Exophiala spinifera TaxID=91928 RepID=A0A0D2B8E3_9EURO|nr:translation initiation factor IF-2 [Exophiala spinifera]KIW14935.1 translation initiation factor IF-2 [Exophiala spinifera]